MEAVVVELEAEMEVVKVVAKVEVMAAARVVVLVEVKEVEMAVGKQRCKQTL